MNLKEILGEELFSQVSEKLGDKKLLIDDGTMIPKSRFDEVNNQKKEYKEQVDTLNKAREEANKDLEKFKKAAEGNEVLQKQLSEYEEKINNANKTFDETLKAKEQEWQQKEINNKKAFAVREKLLLEHADSKYIDILMNQIDLNNITEKDGAIIGIDDVVSGLKTNYEKLFGKPQIKGTEITAGVDPVKTESLSKLAEKAKSGSMQDRIAYAKAKMETNN